MHNKTVFDNGLKIITENQTASRLVSVGIWVEVGSRDEHDLNNGCAHFAEHMFFKGTAQRSALQIAQEFDVLGGAGNAFTSREGTCFYATVLDSHLPKVVELLTDLLTNSRFAPEDIEREQQVILQEINMVEDTPDDQIHDLFAAQLWGHHPMGNTVLGNRGVVAAMNAKKLTDYLAAHYRPDRMIISAAGKIDHDQFVNLWGPLIALPKKHSPLNRTPPPRLPATREVTYKPLEQVHMLLGTYGLTSGADERYAYLLLNILLGGNMSSRLFQEIREKNGLVYSIYSDISSYKDCGSLYIYLGVDRPQMNKALDLTLHEVKRLKDHAINPAELTNAKEYVKAGLYLAAENLEAIMMRLVRNEITFGRNISLDEVTKAINRVRPEEVEQLAVQVFKSDQLTMTALGPLAAEELDRIGF